MIFSAYFAENIIVYSDVLRYDEVMYIHELKEWPNFTWDKEKIASMLIHISKLQGLLIGGMKLVGFKCEEEVVLQTLTQDVLKSSEIEGEILDRSLVRSSIARHLGIDVAGVTHKDRNVEGVVEMMLDATQKYDIPVTKERLYRWHKALFPTAWRGFSKIKVGEWRKEKVQVISGRLDNEIIHFEGPSAGRINQEMKVFIKWLHQEKEIDFVLQAAIAHLWFVTIHPFDDGNGRISRAIADLLLARSEKSSRRFYSLSAQIQKERKDYYQILEQTQKDGLEITAWIEWFFQCLIRAIENALLIFENIKNKEQFWKNLAGITLNERQRKIINRMMDGFEGKLTSSKWAKIAKCSQDSAYRDILDLVDKGILFKNPEGGRSTSYSLSFDEQMKVK